MGVHQLGIRWVSWQRGSVRESGMTTCRFLRIDKTVSMDSSDIRAMTVRICRIELSSGENFAEVLVNKFAFMECDRRCWTMFWTHSNLGK